MKSSEVKIIQKHLASKNLYSGLIDGDRGEQTNSAINASIEKHSNDFPTDWNSWSNRRKAIAYLQWLCNLKGIDAGVVDGYYGPQTASASEQLLTLDKTGVIPRGFDDIEPIDTNPNNFPNESYSDLKAYYGDPCQGRLVKVDCPWTLRFDWSRSQTTKTITIHEKLADSLKRVLDEVYSVYGIEGIKKHGLHYYGGSYNCRKKRGSRNSWSTHAWGIAIDWYPSKNKLRSNEATASLAQPELDTWWEIWEKEGWLSLGRKENRDWMHVQAARR
ncbi:MAG: M15 family metallopeptidase [Campylobacterota bacterium]|nr:M15 family metallopeptidase [Campylobacterota bacterium]